MNVIFTVVAFSRDNCEIYLNATKKLASDILSKTSHSLLITTNNKKFFEDIQDKRVIIRDSYDPNLLFFINNEFNYNSKYEAFVNLPQGFDYIIYLDGDLKLTHWDKNSDDYLVNFLSKYEFGANRLNALLSYHYNCFKTLGQDLFQHKFLGHDLLDIKSDDIIMTAKMPSEHFLIFRYNKEKIELFAKNWKEQCFYLQNKGNPYGTLCDGFEIGVSLARSNYVNIEEVTWVDSVNTLGFLFNGNRSDEKN